MKNWIVDTGRNNAFGYGWYGDYNGTEVLISLFDVKLQFHKDQFPTRSIPAVRDPLKHNGYVVPHGLLHLHLVGELKPNLKRRMAGVDGNKFDGPENVLQNISLC